MNNDRAPTSKVLVMSLMASEQCKHRSDCAEVLSIACIIVLCRAIFVVSYFNCIAIPPQTKFEGIYRSRLVGRSVLKMCLILNVLNYHVCILSFSLNLLKLLIFIIMIQQYGHTQTGIYLVKAETNV